MNLRLDRRWNGLLAALIVAVLSFAQPAVARQLELRGAVDGVPNTLVLQLRGNQVDGLLREGGLTLALRGTLENRQLQARLVEPTSGLPLIRVEGRLHRDGLDAVLTPIGDGAPRTVQFAWNGAAGALPAAAQSPQADASARGALDSRLVGRWVHQTITSSSGGAGGSASFATERVVEFGADGRVRQAVRSAGGGGSWSATGGGDESEGRWQVRGGELWVAEGGGRFDFAASYRFSGPYLVMERNGQRQIWSR